ncbi:uncharacterized protein RHOBADRAFT_66605 [Rhodotorula graminis WP1]|uniref:RNase H type-1 domain-containing protein n=1 Tax=Rhodotorula graminis (strain WP1) TaxID=578459 RepID=A0A194S4Q2_RHOGW|nr:uncharacterized protein RHOBADRAFT_66605 [Rhodotorula graminis WP1]KPV74401.1 hypothetical protein RHOBADRAFT_66605 [Rhodotorula graminis WP1]
MTMLGARIDAELTFAAHRRTCVSRAAQAAGGVGLLARARVGLSARHTRAMVRACVYPKMLALLDGLGPSDLVGYSDGSLIDGRAGAGWALRAVFCGEEPMMTVVVSWVPGHAEVEGNERADAQAKVGAEVVEVEGGVGEGRQQGRKSRRHSMVMPRGGSVEPSDDEHDECYGGERETSLQAESNQPPRPRLPALVNPPDGLEDLRSEPKSIAAVQQAFHQAQQAAWAASWATAPTGAGLRSVTGKVAPGASFARYHATLSRRQSTLLARLRLDFTGLAAHLHRIQRHPTGLCECGEEETRAHFLLACPLYAAPRAALVRATGKDAMPPLATLLNDLALARPVLKFVNDTGRFPRLHEAVKDSAGTVKQGV